MTDKTHVRGGKCVIIYGITMILCHADVSCMRMPVNSAIRLIDLSFVYMMSALSALTEGEKNPLFLHFLMLMLS